MVSGSNGPYRFRCLQLVSSKEWRNKFEKRYRLYRSSVANNAYFQGTNGIAFLDVYFLASVVLLFRRLAAPVSIYIIL